MPIFGPAVSERDMRWIEATHLWLESRGSDNTRRVYSRALNDFFRFTDKAPYDVLSTDVARWVDDMRRRGLSGATIRVHIAAISSLYTYAMHNYTVAEAASERPLHTFNPARVASRPRATEYVATYLTSDQVRALLHAIPRDTIQGLRDYAMFLMYVATGRRKSEIRTLRWGDFQVLDARVFFYWGRPDNVGKGKQRLDECPPPVWYAILNYLHTAGRLDGIQNDRYIFTGLRDPGTRPLSGRQVTYLLKDYAERAGLDPASVRVHTLRHTAAMLRKEAGDDVTEISELLGHASLAITQRYLHKLEGHKDASWRKVEELLGL